MPFPNFERHDCPNSTCELGAITENGGVDYKTIATRAEAELEISRSRFLARIERVEDEAEAREVIDRARSEHPKARHHCSAFVLGPDAAVQRSNDDGEPSGTAGAPILDALTSSGLSDVVAVVTRYFGGVLLGAGGLTRAYRAAVAEAVLGARIVTRSLRQELTIDLAYDVAPQLEAEARRRAWAIVGAQYGETVTQTYAVAKDQVAALAALAAEFSAGAAIIEPGGVAYVDE